MRITSRTQAAVTLMAALTQDQPVSLQRLAAAQGRAVSSLATICAALVAAGLIVGRPGIRGGYSLARDPDAITLEDVRLAVERDNPATPGSAWDFAAETIHLRLNDVLLADVFAALRQRRKAA